MVFMNKKITFASLLTTNYKQMNNLAYTFFYFFFYLYFGDGAKREVVYVPTK